MIEFDFSLWDRLYRKSDVRRRLSIILRHRGPTHAKHLADLAGIDMRDLKAAMYGEKKRYREAFGLAVVGLVRESADAFGTEYALTATGEYAADRLIVQRRERGWA